MQAHALGSGQAALSTALSNLEFPVRLIMPMFFTESYVRSLKVKGSGVCEGACYTGRIALDRCLVGGIQLLP